MMGSPTPRSPDDSRWAEAPQTPREQALLLELDERDNQVHVRRPPGTGVGARRRGGRVAGLTRQANQRQPTPTNDNQRHSVAAQLRMAAEFGQSLVERAESLHTQNYDLLEVHTAPHPIHLRPQPMLRRRFRGCDRKRRQ